MTGLSMHGMHFLSYWILIIKPSFIVISVEKHQILSCGHIQDDFGNANFKVFFQYDNFKYVSNVHLLPNTKRHTRRFWECQLYFKGLLSYDNFKYTPNVHFLSNMKRHFGNENFKGLLSYDNFKYVSNVHLPNTKRHTRRF